MVECFQDLMRYNSVIYQILSNDIVKYVVFLQCDICVNIFLVIFQVMMGLGAGWAVSLALCFPPFFAVAPYSYSPGLGACVPDFTGGIGALWYSAIYTAFTLLLPATLIICCNLKVLNGLSHPYCTIFSKMGKMELPNTRKVHKARILLGP